MSKIWELQNVPFGAGVSVGLFCLALMMMCHGVSVGDLAFSRCKCGILCGGGVSIGLLQV